MLEAVPVKLQNLTNLFGDGSNFDFWVADVEQYLGMIFGASAYLVEGVLPTVPEWKDEVVQGLNSILHWTIDRQLRLPLRAHSPVPSLRMAHLHNLDSGETFANLLSLFDHLKQSIYDPSVTTLDIHIAKISGRAGLTLPNDVFVAFLAVGIPKKKKNCFKVTVSNNLKAKLTTAGIARALGVSDIAFKRQILPTII
ncbi:hypothetical protein CROQUDRAFT_135456 [Cronartium quercuum f. sp. fusiforme G11]|uniref:Uncharacterized protein n=1 Tax=Cronartium quercuum f. sp. fusiforme G11 TaxID=708437 RepID=A0A9P6N9S0_9BASI|nr:hypothetical protein CROQUDRAFT_135456 [Cronartium quercuum f. sp. fusiforme G11]